MCMSAKMLQKAGLGMVSVFVSNNAFLSCYLQGIRGWRDEVLVLSSLNSDS